MTAAAAATTRTTAQLDAIWRSIHKDSKGMFDGRRSIVGGRGFIFLDEMSDADFDHYLKYARTKTASELREKAVINAIKAAGLDVDNFMGHPRQWLSNGYAGFCKLLRAIIKDETADNAPLSAKVSNLLAAVEALPEPVLNF